MSDFMNDIAQQAKALPVVEEVEVQDDRDILTRQVAQKASDDERSKRDALTCKPKNTITRKQLTEQHVDDTPHQQTMLIEQMASNMKRLEEQLAEVIEISDTMKKKYPFAEGATATNHTSGEQIVFSRGQWWFLDANE